MGGLAGRMERAEDGTAGRKNNRNEPSLNNREKLTGKTKQNRAQGLVGQEQRI